MNCISTKELKLNDHFVFSWVDCRSVSVLQLLAAGRVGRLSFELPVTGSPHRHQGRRSVRNSLPCLASCPHWLHNVMSPTDASFVFPPDLIGELGAMTSCAIPWQLNKNELVLVVQSMFSIYTRIEDFNNHILTNKKSKCPYAKYKIIYHKNFVAVAVALLLCI